MSNSRRSNRNTELDIPHTRRENDSGRSRSGKFNHDEKRQPTQQAHSDYDASNNDNQFDLVSLQPDISVYADMDEEASTQDLGLLPGPGYGLGFGTGQARKANSATATSTSFLTMASPSIETENGSQGLVIVHHKRRYSEASNRTSGASSDDRHFSTPDEGEWNMPAQRVTQVETFQENHIPGPHDQEYILLSMSSSTPRTVPNPYQLYSTVSDIEPSYQDLNHFNYQAGTTYYGNVVLPRQTNVQNEPSGPWNPVHHQVPAYPTGLVAFAPVPGPAANYGMEEMTSPSVSFSGSRSARNGKSADAVPQSRKSPAKAKSIQIGWEHTTVSRGGLECVIENAEAPCHRTGIRKGKLDPEAAERARRMRKLKACWNCWIQKITCSEGETCDKCRKQFSPTADQLCCRAGFVDYVEIFFPSFLHEHLRKRRIEDLISEHTAHFTNTVFDVEVSTGEVFTPMVLRVNVFQPKTQELLQHSRLVSENNQDLQLFDEYSAPVGILGLEPVEMKAICNSHIESMISNPQYVDQTTVGDTSQIPGDLLRIIIQYCASNDAPLLRNALKLHAIHYFMKSLVTFSPSSAQDIYNSLHYSRTTQSHLSSRLLNRQIKYTMLLLHREITASFLKSLEASLRSRTKDSWAPSFCAILVLCFCIEKLQTAADTMVVCEIQKRGKEAQWTRDTSFNACQQLEELPFGMCRKLFHDIYRTRKEGNGGMREAGFNPLKAVREGQHTRLDKKGDTMARDIYVVTCNHSPEILDLAERQPMVGLGEIIEPQAIKDNSNGRLAAKFLKSFFWDE